MEKDTWFGLLEVTSVPSSLSLLPLLRLTAHWCSLCDRHPNECWLSIYTWSSFHIWSYQCTWKPMNVFFSSCHVFLHLIMPFSLFGIWDLLLFVLLIASMVIISVIFRYLLFLFLENGGITLCHTRHCIKSVSKRLWEIGYNLQCLFSTATAICTSAEGRVSIKLHSWGSIMWRWTPSPWYQK